MNEQTMNEKVRRAARLASLKLAEAGIRHAICGGLAVVFYGYPRMTVDVDFAVGEDAFEHHAGGLVTLKVPLVRIDDVAVDFVTSSRFDTCSELLDGVPVVDLPTLVEMKLRAGRQRDLADLVELIKRGAIEPATIPAPDELHLAERWQRVLRLAATEAE